MQCDISSQEDLYLAVTNILRPEFAISVDEVRNVWQTIGRITTHTIANGNGIRIPFFGNLFPRRDLNGKSISVEFVPSKKFIERFKANAQSKPISHNTNAIESQWLSVAEVSESIKHSADVKLQLRSDLEAEHVHKIIKSLSLSFGYQLAKGKRVNLSLPTAGQFCAHQRWFKFEWTPEVVKTSESGNNSKPDVDDKHIRAVKPPVSISKSPMRKSPRLKHLAQYKTMDPIAAALQNEEMVKWLWNEFRSADRSDHGLVPLDRAVQVLDKIVRAYCKRFGVEYIQNGSDGFKMVRVYVKPFIIKDKWLGYRNLMKCRDIAQVDQIQNFETKGDGMYLSGNEDNRGLSSQHRQALQEFRDLLFTLKITLMDLFKQCQTTGTQVVLKEDFQSALHNLGFSLRKCSIVWEWACRYAKEGSMCQTLLWREFERSLSVSGGRDVVSSAVLAIQSSFKSKVELRHQFRSWLATQKLQTTKRGPSFRDVKGIPLERFATHLQVLLDGKISARDSLELARITDKDGDNFVTEAEFFDRFASESFQTPKLSVVEKQPLAQIEEFLLSHHLTASELIAKLDKNNDGIVTVGEFVAGLMKQFPGVSSDVAEDLASRCAHVASADLVDVRAFACLIDGGEVEALAQESLASPTRNIAKTSTFEQHLERIRLTLNDAYPTPQHREKLFSKLKHGNKSYLEVTTFIQGLLREMESLCVPLALSPVQKSSLVRYADLNRDGYISIEEFQQFLGDRVVGHSDISQLEQPGHMVMFLESNHTDWVLHLCRAISLATVARGISVKSWFQSISDAHHDTVTCEQLEEGIRNYIDVLNPEIYSADWLRCKFMNDPRLSNTSNFSSKATKDSCISLSLEALLCILDVNLGMEECSSYGTESVTRQSKSYLGILERWGRSSAECFLRTRQRRDASQVAWVVSQTENHPKAALEPLGQFEKLEFIGEESTKPSQADGILILLSDRAFKHRVTIAKLFELMDRDCDGFLSLGEFSDSVSGHNPGVVHLLGVIPRDEQESVGDWITQAFSLLAQGGEFACYGRFQALLAEPIHPIGWEQKVFDKVTAFGADRNWCPHQTFLAIASTGRSTLSQRQSSKLARWRTTQQQAFEANPLDEFQNSSKVSHPNCRCNPDSKYPSSGSQTRTISGAQVCESWLLATPDSSGAVVGSIPSIVACAKQVGPAASLPLDRKEQLSMSAEEMQEGLAQCCGVQMLERQFDELLRILDMDGNSRVSENEFIKRVTPYQYTWGVEEFYSRIICSVLWNKFGDKNLILNGLFRGNRSTVTLEAFQKFVESCDTNLVVRHTGVSLRMWHMIVRKMGYRLRIATETMNEAEMHLMLRALYNTKLLGDVEVTSQALAHMLSYYEQTKCTLQDVADASFEQGMSMTSVFKRFVKDSKYGMGQQEFVTALTWLCPSVRACEVEQLWSGAFSASMSGRQFVSLFTQHNQSLPIEWELETISTLRKFFAANQFNPSRTLCFQEKASMMSCLLRVVGMADQHGANSEDIQSVTIRAMREALRTIGVGNCTMRAAQRIVWTVRALAWLEVERASRELGSQQSGHQRSGNKQRGSGGHFSFLENLETIPQLGGTVDVSISDATKVLGPCDSSSGERPNRILREEATLIYAFRIQEQIRRRCHGDCRKCWHQFFANKRTSHLVTLEQFECGLANLFTSELSHVVPLKTTMQQLFYIMGAEHSPQQDSFVLHVEQFTEFCSISI